MNEPPRTNFIWVPTHLAISWHNRLIDRFGGAPGIRDAGLLESALDQPKNLAAYHPSATLVQMAALYGVGLAKAHAFTDGNERIAFAVMVAFLKAQGEILDSSEAEAAKIMIDVASGAVNETALRDWLTFHCRSEDR